MVFFRSEMDYFEKTLVIDTTDLKLQIEDNKVAIIGYDATRENQYKMGEYNIECNNAQIADLDDNFDLMPDFRLVAIPGHSYLNEEEYTRVIQLLNNYMMKVYVENMVLHQKRVDEPDIFGK